MPPFTNLDSQPVCGRKRPVLRLAVGWLLNFGLYGAATAAIRSYERSCASPITGVSPGSVGVWLCAALRCQGILEGSGFA